jgi:DNA polymerase-3 subunit beta
MKFICEGNDLAEAVSVVSRALSVRTSDANLEGIKITAKDGMVTFCATDLEIYIQKVIRADIEKEGVALVPGKIFNDYCMKIGGNQVKIEMKGDTMCITHGENTCDFQCLLLIEYPDVVNLDKKPHFSIKADELRDLITKTRISVSNDDAHPVLKGILCEIYKDKLVAVSLDSFRATRLEKPIKNHAAEARVIVPARSFDEIKKLIAEDNGEVGIIIDGKFFQVNMNKTSIAGRLIDGEYVDHKKIIPTAFESNAVVERTVFERAIERAGLLIRNDKVNFVTLNIAERLITVNSANDIGKIAEKVATKLTGKDIKICFNARYLYDILHAANDEFIKISYNSESSPCIIDSAKPCDYMFLILPIRRG